MLISVIISAGIQPESKKPIEEVVRVVGCRITGFLFESRSFRKAKEEMCFIISSNWFILEEGVPPRSARTQMQIINVQIMRKIKTSSSRMKSAGDPA